MPSTPLRASWPLCLRALTRLAVLCLLLGSRWAAAQTGEPQTTVNQVVVGQNVNMAGGPASYLLGRDPALIGDPFLQRQNEPSLATSSRNPCHLLAGANDYRAVDIEEAAGEVGDAWLGVFKSFDCGATWKSTLLPGHKLDTTPAGLGSPLKGLAAAADPTVRAGTSGLFYYSGIAFNRGDGEVGKVFVARFIDNNNKDGGDPIEYLGAAQIDLGTSGQFLDKPWIVADIPRDGATCSINGRAVPAGPVYLTYTSFLGSGNNVRSKILFSRSTDCGATWSNPAKLSERVARNQGTTISVDPGTGAIYIAWREFKSPDDATSRDAILVVRSQDGGKSFTKASAITPGGYQFSPFDQASSPLTFRTNAYPTLAVVPAEAEGRAAGQPGSAYVAWAARGFGAARPSDARIVVSRSTDSVNWTNPRPTDSYADAGHQIMPAMAFAGGKLALAYYDLRDDASGGFDDMVIEFGQAAFDRCMASPGPSGPLGFAAVLSCVVNDPAGLSRRHTLDMRAAMADTLCLSAGSCDFTSYSVVGGGSRKVSRYVEGRGSNNGPRVQLQYNRPNLPIFSKGRFPFIGDYIDIAGQSFVPTAEGGWAWNTGQNANRPSPVFHVSWADNRNVGTPRDRNWERFTPPVLGPGNVVCAPGQVGIRNQDVYTAQLRPGLVVSAPFNSKRITGLQRSFAVVVQNTTDTEREYELTANPPAGVIASFDQFRGFGALDSEGNPSEALTGITVRIPRRSSASRTVFVGLADAPVDQSAAPDVLIPVRVDEVAVSGTPTGVADTVYLNPDFENPDFENPDFENRELHNPDFENPDFENPDYENPDYENPDFENPDFENFTLNASSSIRNPDFENPDFENPDYENPDYANPDFENPDFENPDYENPDFENPDYENPDFENPDFENPDFENGSFQVSDTTWPVRNKGNTTSAYKTNVFVNDPPQGVRYQLAVRKVFPSPAAVCAVPGSASAALFAQSVPLVNIVGPNVQVSPFDRNFNDPSRDNATFSLAPGERGVITLRAYCDEGDASCSRDLIASLQGRVALGVVAQGANCAVCTGASCSLTDLVKGGTECVIDNGPPKDIYDPIPPVVTLQPVTTPTAIDQDNSGQEPVAFTLSATDNVGVASVTCSSATVAVTSTGTTGDLFAFAGDFPVGNTSVTCTAQDVRQTPGPNAASATFDVVVTDVTPPVFEAVANPGSPFLPANPAEATGPDGAQVFYSNPPATDSNGGTVTVACASSGGLVSGSIFPIGVTDINCTATDVSGVSTPPINLFDITVADGTPPTITVTGAPSSAVEGNVLGGATLTFAASATDLVSGALSAACSPVSGSVLPVGSTTVTCLASDGAGNTGSSSFPVLVVDTKAPVLTLAGPGTVTMEAGSTFTDPGATAMDIVSGPLAVSIAGSVNSLAPGSYVITYSATDGAGNSASTTRTVAVVDTTAPTVSVTGAPVGPVQGNTLGGAIVNFTAQASDGVSSGLVASCSPVSGSVFPVGTISVACSATDAAGNGGATSFAVTVIDTLKPAVTLVGAAAITIEAGSGYTDSGATALDVVSGSLTVTTSGAVNPFAMGTYILTYSATDAAGNTATATRTVTVSDTQAPVVTATANPPTLLWSPNKTMTPVTVSGKITEPNLKSASYKVVDEYGRIQPAGVITVGAGGNYSFTVSLEAYRNGNDSNGRLYTITVTATDMGNRSTSAQAVVTVPHNQ